MRRRYINKTQQSKLVAIYNEKEIEFHIPATYVLLLQSAHQPLIKSGDRISNIKIEPEEPYTVLVKCCLVELIFARLDGDQGLPRST